MKKANTETEFINSIRNGKFTLDGRDLSMPFISLNDYKLKSLVGCPQHGVYQFKCSTNNLTSLKGCPSKIGSTFICSDNRSLTSLEDGPVQVGSEQRQSGCYSFRDCNVSSWKGIPTHIWGNLYAQDNNLREFEDAPVMISGDCNISNNPFTSFHDIHKHIQNIDRSALIFLNCEIEECILGILLINNLKVIVSSLPPPVDNIITSYLPMGKAGVYKCAQELVTAGYTKLAKL